MCCTFLKFPIILMLLKIDVRDQKVKKKVGNTKEEAQEREKEGESENEGLVSQDIKKGRARTSSGLSQASRIYTARRDAFRQND